MAERLTPDQEQIIREGVEAGDAFFSEDVEDLLAEIDALRAENARLRAAGEEVQRLAKLRDDEAERIADTPWP